MNPRSAIFRRAMLAFAVAGVAALLSPPSAWSAVGFMPHRAIYKLAMSKARSGGVVDAQGQLELEWADVCDGWVVRQRTRLRVTRAEGGDLQNAWSLNAWEAKDGLSYRFFFRHLLPGGQSVERRGRARLGGPGEAGEAVYSFPEERRITLPEGTLFPSEHSFQQMELAADEVQSGWHLVFDGGAERGLYGISTTLAKTLPGAAEEVSPLLRQQRSWRLSLAFFPMDQEAAEAAMPDHEQSVRVFANGVIDEITLDYGEFVLDASLQELEALPAPDCR